MWHGLVGAQLAPVVQAPHMPLWQTAGAHEVPHDVPSGWLVVGEQTLMPPVHESSPFWQAFTVHASPGWQLTEHEPDAQYISVPQLVPFGAGCHAFWHTGLPVKHEMVPSRQGSDEVQDAPASHAPHWPAAQVCPGPHDVPSGCAQLSLQTGEPVEQSIVPCMQGLVGVQVAPELHDDTHAPPWQIRPVPHEVPSAR